MQEKISHLKTLLGEVADLYYTIGLLEWDQQCYMPPQGAEGRSHHLETLYRLYHQKYTSPELGELLEDLQSQAAGLDPDSDEARLVSVTADRYAKRARVPADFVAEYARVTAIAHHVWEGARAENDFARFRPHLERVVELRREYAAFFAPYEHVYDPLLDEFEPGMQTAEVQAIFNALRPQQVELIQAIAARPQVDASFLYQPYDGQKQWDFGVEVVTRFGYDWQRGRQDKAVHPFTQTMALDDVRITTRILPDYVGSALFSTMHEAGHALYEMGIDPKYARTPLGRGQSLILHESQSRTWENLVGRSLPFWEHFYPRLQSVFQQQLGNVDLRTFYKGINQVEPSFIRVEADEATYNLHIMLRLELEIALMEGQVQVADLPAAWNDRMQAYLGVTPPTDTLGVLQDTHWANGYIGYFATYALGNLVSAQLWEAAQRDIPGLAGHIRRGEFAPLLDWQRQHIHQYGFKFTPQEVVQRATGSKIDPAPYVRYLNQKYGEIYGL
jgi:carboxypeptidase Taq